MDAEGTPLGMTISPANRPDRTMVEATLDAISPGAGASMSNQSGSSGNGTPTRRTLHAVVWVTTDSARRRHLDAWIRGHSLSVKKSLQWRTSSGQPLASGLARDYGGPNLVRKRSARQKQATSVSSLTLLMRQDARAKNFPGSARLRVSTEQLDEHAHDLADLRPGPVRRERHGTPLAG